MEDEEEEENRDSKMHGTGRVQNKGGDEGDANMKTEQTETETAMKYKDDEFEDDEEEEENDEEDEEEADESIHYEWNDAMHTTVRAATYLAEKCYKTFIPCVRTRSCFFACCCVFVRAGGREKGERG